MSNSPYFRDRIHFITIHNLLVRKKTIRNPLTPLKERIFIKKQLRFKKSSYNICFHLMIFLILHFKHYLIVSNIAFSMNTRLKSLTIHVLLLLLLCSSADKLAAQDAVVLKATTEIVIKNNKLTRNQNFSVLINNRDGEKYCDVEIRSSNLVKVSRINASIEDLAGKEIKKLRSGDIHKHKAFNEIAFYDDNMVQEFSLRHTSFPYILHYSFQEEEDQFLYIEHWSPVIFRHISTAEASLQLTIPAGYKISYRNTPPLGFSTDSVDNQITYRWKYSYLSQFPADEKFSPDIQKLYPYVKIVPLQFRFENKGSMDSWKDFGNWEYTLIESRQQLTDAEKTTISGLTQNMKDTVEIVKTIYHYLQDGTRYINVSEKTGGMVPHPASYVCTNKYGDCKALSNYMISMLKYLGIRAIYCSIYAGDKIRTIDRNFPSQQSNHVIVCVPLNKDSLWLDCTSKLPFNYLGTFTQAREVMLTEKDNCHFTRTPALQAKDVKCSRTISITPNAGLEATMLVQGIYRGEDFEEIASLLSGNKNNKDLYARNKLIAPGEELSSYEIVKGNRDSACIAVNYATTSKSVFARYGNDIVLKTVSMQLPRFEKPSQRKYPVQIDYPVYYCDTQHYLTGKLFNIHHLPEKIVLKSGYGEYSCSYSINNDTLKVEKTFLLKPGLISLKEYPAFYSFINGAYEKEKSTCMELISKP